MLDVCVVGTHNVRLNDVVYSRKER